MYMYISIPYISPMYKLLYIEPPSLQTMGYGWSIANIQITSP